MREKLVAFTTVIASIFFTLLALEIGLRTYHNEWANSNFRFPQAMLDRAAFDAELGWVPKQGVWQVNEWRAVVTAIEDGVRSNGTDQAPDSAETILAVGDSFTFGDQVSDWETWPAQLEKLSKRRVINGGVFAYGIDQAFLRARRLLDRYRVNTLIFSFISYDIGRCQLSRLIAGKPYFEFQDGHLLLKNVPVPPPPARPRESALLIALEHSRLVDFFMTRLFPTWWLTGHIEPWTQTLDKETGRQVACALLHEVEAVANSHGAELIVLVQRTMGDTSDEQVDIQRVLSCLSDPATRILDLKPALSALKGQDPTKYDRLYLPPGGHMSAEGNRLVALEILKTLPQRSAQSDPDVL